MSKTCYTAEDYWWWCRYPIPGVPLLPGYKIHGDCEKVCNFRL